MRHLPLVLVVVGGCGDPPVVATVPEPAGMNCPNGGYAVESGTDRNGNGELDPSEVRNTSYVCFPAQPRELVAVVDEPPGAHCTNGGSAIEIGFDDNGNGTLDASEVATTSYVCKDLTTATLVAVVTEPHGANCANGGEAIETGPDTNHNNVLDPGEVTSTAYVCSGANGLDALVRIDAEPIGANCAGGGKAIRVGIDTNADQILEDSEVQSSTYLCGPPPVEGDVIIHNSLDVAVVFNVAVISGNLTIDSSSLTSIELPNLQHLGGTLSCGGMSSCPVLATISFPSLTFVGGGIHLDDHILGPITFPSSLVPGDQSYLQLGAISNTSLPLTDLTTANLVIRSAPNLTSISLPNLTSGGLSVFDANALMSVSLPVFATTDAGGIPLLIGSTSLVTLSLPSFTSGLLVLGGTSLSSLSLPAFHDGDFQLINSTEMTTLDLPAFQSGSVYLYQDSALSSLSLPVLSHASINVESASALTSLSLPALQSLTNIGITKCAALTSITAPMLSSGTGYFIVTNNPHLPTCQAQALAMHGTWTTLTISGNDDTATCP